MDRRRNLVTKKTSGSVEMIDLPLVYEYVLPERALRHDTGQNAFRCERVMIVDIHIPKDTEGNGSSGYLTLSSYHDGYEPINPWSNMIASRDICDLESQYGERAIVEARKLQSQLWYSKTYGANYVNPNATMNANLLNEYNGKASLAITGLLIGNNKSGGDKTMKEGTIIQVWGI